MKPVAKVMLLLITVCTIATTMTMSVPKQTEAFSERVLEVGATGNDVRELQYRLKFLGFYGGAVDGDFGWSTYWALRNFQYEFGLDIDGLAGPRTKLMLYNATAEYRPTAAELGVAQPGAVAGPQAAPSPTPAAPASAPRRAMRAAGVSENDIRLMANCVFGEARGEPYIGQVAIASVIMNRTRNPAFPNTPSGVIFEPLAFTAVADGQIWLEPDETARRAVQDALNGWDPTNGATYYFNPDTATSAWIWGRPQIKRIGKHIFCR